MFPKLPKQDKPRRGSPVSSHDHDPETNILSVTFHHGKTYTYSGVPKDLADGLRDAPSKGTFLMQNIIGKFAHKKETSK